MKFFLILNPSTDGDADSGVDESTQGDQGEQEGVELRRPQTATISRIPRRTPPESPMKRARPPQQSETRRMPR